MKTTRKTLAEFIRIVVDGRTGLERHLCRVPQAERAERLRKHAVECWRRHAGSAGAA
jgi:hypothetical protein